MRKKTEIVDGVTHIYLPYYFEFTPLKKKPENANRKYEVQNGMRVMVEEMVKGVKVIYLQEGLNIEDIRAKCR